MGRHAFNVKTSGDETCWYALRVRPQAEYITAYMLRSRGVRTYVATETRWRRRSRHVVKPAEFAYPQIPGIVFAGFPGQPQWLPLLSNQLVLGAIGYHGEPFELDPGRLHRFFASALNGHLVVARGLSMVHIEPSGQGPSRLVRAPTTQVRIVSKRKLAEPEVVEATGSVAAVINGLRLPAQLRAAA